MTRAWRSWKAARPETTFLALGTVLGVIYLLATPPLRVPDEYRHLRRVVQIASGGLTGGVAIPASVEQLAAVLRDDRTRDRRHSHSAGFPAAKLAAAAAIPLAAGSTTAAPPDRYLPYGPVAYLPAVLAVAAATALDARPLTLLYLARLSLLATGIALLFGALRATTALAWPLSFVALLPTAVFLRSGITADTVTTALAFLLFATLLRLRDGARAIGGGEVALLVLIGSCLALAKTGYWPLTWAALALPRTRFAARGARRRAVALAIGVPAVAGALWLAALDDWTSADHHRRADAAEQLRLLVEHPARIFLVLEATWLSPARLGQLASAFVGRVVALAVPVLFVPLAVVVVALLVIGDPRGPSPSLRERSAHAGAALACVVVISIGLYLNWTAPGSATVRGFQGRYLYPLAPFVLYALVPPRRLRFASSPRLAVALVVLLVLTMNACGVWSIVAATWLGTP